MGGFAQEHARTDDADTSHQAAESVETSAKQLKNKIHTFLKTSGPVTSEEVATRLRLAHDQSWRRMSDLKNDGVIVDSGERRRNSSGRKATVWILRAAEPTDLFGEPLFEPERGVSCQKGKRKPTKPRGHVRPPGSGPVLEKCGTCHHLTRVNHGHIGGSGKKYLKCFLAKNIWTCGPGSDVRAKDPACELWEMPHLVDEE